MIMCRSNLNGLLVIVVALLLLQLWTIEARPRTQKIVVHGHEWTVPNEPGWEKVLQEAEAYRHNFLTNCASSRDCRKAAEQLRDIFLKHPVSAKHYNDPNSNDLPSNDIDSIFKWG